jgi:hypothetical protein
MKYLREKGHRPEVIPAKMKKTNKYPRVDVPNRPESGSLYIVTTVI